MNPSFWRGKKVLLTGHTGFKGSWLTAILHECNANILGISLPPDTNPNHFDLLMPKLKLQSQLLDIRHIEQLRAALRKFEPEIVIHMAAQALVRESYRSPVDTYATNVMGTVNLLECCRELASVKAIVVVTTDKCYENDNRGVPFKESDRLGGHDPYSNSKACAELVTDSMRRSFLGSVGLATARAGNVIGGGDWSADRIIPDIIRACAKGMPVKIRNPKSVRPWQHVLDLSVGYLELAEKLHAEPATFSKAYNFGPQLSAPVFTVEDILVHAKGILGSRLKWDFDPGPHPHEAAVLRLDCTLAFNELKWRPRMSTEESIRETFKWYESFLRSPEAAVEYTLSHVTEIGEALWLSH